MTAVVAGSGTAYANTLYPPGCSTAATGLWWKNCTAGEAYVNHANFVTAVQRVLAGDLSGGGYVRMNTSGPNW